MTYREKVVYEAVERVIAMRAAAHRFPECALQSEIRDECNDYLTEACTKAAECIGAVSEISRNGYADVLASLVSSGYLTVHPAQN